MSKKILANALASKICEAIGIDPNNVRRMVIDLQAGHAVKIYFENFGTEELLTVDWGSLKNDAEIIAVTAAK